VKGEWKGHMKNRIIIGISGASGVIYGIELLKELSKKDMETHLIISESGKKNISIETDYSIGEVQAMADVIHDEKDFEAPPASGSFLTWGMVIAPCTIKTLSGIAHSYSGNLLVRAADVTLKEKRKLVLLVRETPLHKGHLNLMSMAADLGAHILPPMPSFYNHPKTIEDIIHQTIGKVFDYFGIEHSLYKRWGENRDEP
jgi:4-hydroxy-3-polyprenylbenzoate decarboxylase